MSLAHGDVLDATLISSAARDSLSRLPDEILQAILVYISPHDAIRFGSACRRFNQIIDAPLLWRHYCETSYGFWNLTDETDPGVRQRKPLAPWRKHFVDRCLRDQRNQDLFESALTTSQGRYTKLREIARVDYEARDLLKKHCNAPDDCEDVLARRYFADATLGLIHRTNALRLWQDLADGKDVSLEEQLTAFDLFIIGKQWGEVADITKALDKIAADIRDDNMDFEDVDDFQKCVLIISHLQQHGYVGLGDGREHRSMKNNFLSFNLLQGDHASLPLQSAVIFCGVARRLGITAHLCNYPAHIYVVVLLDGLQVSQLPNQQHTIYLDPYSDDKPVSLSGLVRRLRMFGIPEDEFSGYLAPAPTREIVLRTCRNIIRSYQDWRRGILQEEPPLMNHDAFYSFLWCMSLVEDSTSGVGGGVWYRPHMTHLTTVFSDHHPEDLDLVDRYISPLFGTHPDRREYDSAMEEMRRSETRPRPVVPRGEDSKHVKYKIGQMLQHKRYGYIGIVRRWDARCLASDQWITQMGVERLPKGKQQPFYDVIAEDRSQRYVAEENIEAVYSDPPAQLMQVAGRYFKRWDADKRVFVSNVRDEYPDD